MNLKEIIPLLKLYPPTVFFEKVTDFNSGIMGPESNTLIQVHLILNSRIGIEERSLKNTDSIGTLPAYDKSMSFESKLPRDKPTRHLKENLFISRQASGYYTLWRCQ